MELLKTLCQIHAPSGNESAMKAFILEYVKKNQANWKVQPTIIDGEEFQDGLILVFGQPKTAVFAHIDTIGFMARYDKELLRIGSPKVQSGYKLRSQTANGEVFGEVHLKKTSKKKNATKKIFIKSEQNIERGTDFSFVCDFRESKNYIQSCYIDNRLGCWVALRLAETLENGAIVFSCWEEVGGGTAMFQAKYLHYHYKIRQALICDISWVTDGVKHGQGVVISLKDSLLPRKKFVEKVVKLAQEAQIPYQLEVEEYGGSDAKELQLSPYPYDWCFIGAPESNVHSPDEKVHKADIDAMLRLYEHLLKTL